MNASASKLRNTCPILKGPALRMELCVAISANTRFRVRPSLYYHAARAGVLFSCEGISEIVFGTLSHESVPNPKLMQT